MLSTKPAQKLLCLSLLLLSACATSPPPAPKLPAPAADLMSPQSESFLQTLEKLLSKKPSELMKSSAD